MRYDELKQYIIENNKIDDILNSLECVGVKRHSKEFRCGLPRDYNTNRISIKINTLKVKIYSREEIIRGDIFTLVMNICNCSFPKSIKKIHDILNLKYSFNDLNKNKENKQIDILDIFKKATYRQHNIKEDMPIYENVCSEYLSIPYLGWVREGILPRTQAIFGIGYSRDKNRIVIPHRYWCGDTNQYVGVMGRTLIENYDILDIPKYFPLKKFPKSMNLYGLQENYEEIQRKGYVNVYESEKSVLKRHSRLDGTGVALCCHEMSEEQIRILISLDVDIIIQMDKDVSLNHVRSMCEKLYHIRNVYYVYDEYGLLNDKESPADKLNKIYQALWNRKVKYNDEEHQKYLEYIKSKE